MDALKIGSLIEHGKWAVRRISIDKNSMHSQAKLKRKEESDIDDWEIETSLLLVYIFTLPTILFLVSMVAKREIAIVKGGISKKLVFRFEWIFVWISLIPFHCEISDR